MRFHSILGLGHRRRRARPPPHYVAAGAAPAQAAPARGLGTTSPGSRAGADGQKFDHNWKDFDIVEAAV